MTCRLFFRQVLVLAAPVCNPQATPVLYGRSGCCVGHRAKAEPQLLPAVSHGWWGCFRRKEFTSGLHTRSIMSRAATITPAPCGSKVRSPGQRELLGYTTRAFARAAREHHILFIGPFPWTFCYAGAPSLIFANDTGVATCYASAVSTAGL